MQFRELKSRPPAGLVLLLVLAAGLLAAPPARAEVVVLIDGTRIQGKLLHYYDGELTLQTPDGVKIKLPAARVKALQFKLPKTRAAFSTPEKTFNRWKQSLLKGKLNRHIDCYALMYQMMMTQMIGGMSKAEFQKMVQGHRQTRYSIVGTRRKGKSLAFLKVKATLPGAPKPQTGELLFVRENGEWKLVPPQFQRPQGRP